MAGPSHERSETKKNMNRFIRQISVAFSAGCFGAVIDSWLVWQLGRQGIPQQFGVAIAPAWTDMFIYRRLAWGGMWGLLFLLPAWRHGFWVGIFSRGILFSLAPTLFQLLYVFPFLTRKGFLGLHLGHLAPLFVLLFNAVWGLAAATWVYIAEH